jgi:hypothetical protein
MAEVKTQSSDTLLTREQLREIEHYQTRFGQLELELTGCMDDFLSVLNRHYFNRENGYLQEQQENLREVVALQSKLESLAEALSKQASGLKSYMVNLQKSVQGGVKAKGESKPSETPVEEKPEEAAKETAKEEAVQEPKKQEEKAPAAPAKASRTPLVDRAGENLAEGSEKGGEISLKLVFGELGLTEPKNNEVFKEITSALHKLLYDRKLIGYSKTSLVFGKDKSLGEMLKDLQPVFVSEALQNLLLEKGLINAGEESKLQLVCNSKREMIYSVSG